MKTTRENINKYLSKLKRGEDCLVEFIDYSRGYIKYIAYKYLTDKSLTEDVIYSVYNKILHNIQSFDKSKNGLAWIVKITQNEAYSVNSLEKKQKGGIITCKTTEQTEFNEDQKLLSFTVERAMSKLEDFERELIEYNIFMGMTIREIASLTNIPKSTVAYKLKQAFIKLKKFLS